MKRFKKSLIFIWVISLWLIFCPSNSMFSAVVGQWYNYGGHEYALVYQDVGGSLGAVSGYWTSLESIAENDFGAHLVTINNASEDAWLFSIFNYDNWIGFYADPRSGGHGWEWVGEQSTYTNWDDGYPDVYANDKIFGSFINSNKKWHSAQNNHWYEGIMERPATVPIPGVTWLLGSGIIGIVGFRKKFQK